MELQDFKQQVKPYSHQYGDIIYGNYSPWMRSFDLEELQNKQIVLLSHWAMNSWKGLDEINGLNLNDFKELRLNSLYTCPFTDWEYSAILPLAFFGNDVKKYFSDQEDMKDYLNRYPNDFSKYLLEGYINEDLNKIHQNILGAGYTSGCLPSDGSNSHVPVCFDFSNGDSMLCLTLVWHNK